MNKALPWNVNGVGFDAREAAREAARRQGKSIGEWLHGIIADHATDMGIEADEMGSRQRVEAVTSKLERLSARSSEHDRRLRSGRVEDLATRRRERTRAPADERDDGDDLYERELSRRAGGRGGRAIEATDPILEDAIEAMERRARRAERRADEAVQSVAELLERNETRRERERDTVTAFAQKLSDIETRLKDGFAPADDNPIRGALARLEARLDRIGRRDAAEAAVVQKGAPGERPAVDSLHRLEEKLNTILDAVHGRPPEPIAETSSIAMTAARAARGGDRRLGEAIADIAKRQQALDGTGSRASARRVVTPFRRDTWERERFEAPVNATTPIAAIQDEIAALAAKIENLPRDLADQQQKARPSIDLDGVRAEIASMSDMLRDFAPRGRVSELEETVKELAARVIDAEPRAAHLDISAIDRLRDQMGEIRDLVAGTMASPPAVERIERRIAALDERLAAPAEHGHSEPEFVAAGYTEQASASPDVSVLEDLVRDLNRKMEAARAPEANPQAFDALQEQIAALASRFEGSDVSLTRMASLEKSMRDLFAHLESTRASVETSAARTAREVLRIAMEEGRSQTEQGAATSLATIQVLQDEADARTKSTLTAVHDTLERVVDRLAVMETEMAAVRAGKPAVRVAQAAAPKATKHPDDSAAKSKASLASADSFLDQILGQRATEPDRHAAGKADHDPDGARADFIAAARRAARAAQTDPSVIDFTQSVAERASPVRATLIEQSRDYVARHKRPVLLGMAAIFVILGTMAIMQRIGLGGGDAQMADATRPAVSRTVAAAQQPRPVRQAIELTPSALPKAAPAVGNSIPGSDPIQTGSIPSLPAFAAQGAAQMAPQPAIPAKLKTMASAGDGAAEYTLATQYAEGRLVPRDFKQAATWYQKAADQGIVPAQYRLASLFEKGLGVTQDKLKAKSLYIRAAEAGNPRAMHNLAVMLADGDGKPDYEGAATWFRKAAQYGVHDSQYNLAILLARGLGTQQSFVQSYQWFAVAATQDDSDAAKKRDEVATKLNAADLAVAKALASSFKPRIADVAATDVQPPPGGWDGASSPSPVNSAKSKISSL